ncbi:ferredoxin [Frankia sp. CcWB3]
MRKVGCCAVSAAWRSTLGLGPLSAEGTRSVKVTVRVDRRACAGSGLCAAMQPDLFRTDPDGRASTLRTVLEDAEETEAARDVGDCCPTEAVIVTYQPTAD